MKTQIDIKSAVIGLVLGVIATLAIGAGSGPAGTYKIAVGPSMMAVIDTRTGEVWAHPANTDGMGDKASTFWQPK